MLKDLLGDAFTILNEYSPKLASLITSNPIGYTASVILTVLGRVFDVDTKNVDSLKTAILTDTQSPDKICQVEDEVCKFLNENVPKLKMPSSVELNVKLNWNS